MAKPFTGQAGSSCHVHLCLYDGGQRPLPGTADLSPGQAFSAAIHEHVLGLAQRELDATRRHVTNWEIQRGFENA